MQAVNPQQIGALGAAETALPQVTVIVPVAGRQYNLEKHLLSLLQQDYPRYTIIFVTQDAHDAAVPVIRKVIAGKTTQSRHIAAGKAIACSQKNHNLLQGVLAAEPATNILVFCDSGHFAHSKWLARLILPLQTSPSIAVSSGYHIIFPAKKCLYSIGRAICVLTLSLIRRIPLFAQPWGGATAIRVNAFRDLRVAELWNTSVVDDVSLADLLQKKRLGVAIPKDADVHTVIDDCSWSAWESWLTRQWAYLKFLFPKLWLLAGLSAIAVSFLVGCSMFIIVTEGLGILPVRHIIACSVFLTAGVLGSTFLRLQHPSPGSFILWYPAVLAALFMAGWCHGRTWFSNSIVWAGITYKTAFGGKVLEIIRPVDSHEEEKNR